ncbi:MAG: hypothetical protein WC466_10040 [Candidatus Izemoplasmatales bacterium]
MKPLGGFTDIPKNIKKVYSPYIQIQTKLLNEKPKRNFLPKHDLIKLLKTELPTS